MILVISLRTSKLIKARPPTSICDAEKEWATTGEQGQLQNILKSIKEYYRGLIIEKCK